MGYQLFAKSSSHFTPGGWKLAFEVDALTSSGMPPTFVAITGNEQAIAVRIAEESPSERLGSTNTSQAASKSGFRIRQSRSER
jgi:hypothetical protein